MRALATGYPGGKVCVGAPPDDGEPFVAYGQLWTAAEIIPKAIAKGRPFWQLDNGFFDPARGRTDAGYYRLSYRSLSPILLREGVDQTRVERLGLKLRPWRTYGAYVLLAMPGAGFGRSIGLDMPKWIETAPATLAGYTTRPVVVRPKDSSRSLREDLGNAWALVTHSSNVAVDAVIEGVPVFVAPSSPAAPVGNLDLNDLEHPAKPDREHWLASLASQQFTIEELREGVAAKFMRLIAAQVDAR